MVVYHKCQLPAWVKRVLLECDGEQFGDQTGCLTRPELLYTLNINIMTGKITLYTYKEDVLIFLRNKEGSPYIGIADSVLAKGSSAISYIRAGKEFLKALENTHYHKIETRTHIENLRKAAAMIGMSEEGIHPGSYKAKDGTFKTEYTFGYVVIKNKKEEGE